MEARRETAREPIAIIGMGCRYPGAAGVHEFWRLLMEGRDAIVEVPRERWNLDEVYDPDPAIPGKMTSRMAGMLPRLEEFDADFFGITPREAPHVDPRQRVILESVWEALEEAGIPPESLAGTPTGVFLSTLTNDYDHLLFNDLSRAEAYSGAGTANSVVANRVSYWLDLHGPSLALDTACSGSLVAIHLACESLLRGESTLALAGGVNINLMPKSNVFFSKAGALSPTGRCRTFDAAADGMVRSDGAGVVVLKRLSAARRDGDPIVATIRATAVNHDGRSNGIMAPNGEAQRAVLEEAYRRAGISPGDVQYVEAHGTATRLGDPIEVRALGTVLSRGRAHGSTCSLGSVKSNIGHTEAAAGVAGVIKTALALRHGVIPPSLNFVTPNPLIPFADLPFRVQTEAGPWPVEGARRIAGVSAFGFGGTNAHVVLEDVESDPARPAVQTPYILPLSARSPEALARMVASWRECLPEEGAALHDACYTASVRRSHHPYRFAVSANSRVELLTKLGAAGTFCESHAQRPRTAFIFSGQGSHWAGMGLELYRTEPVFRNKMDECADCLQALSGDRLMDELARPETESRIGDTRIAQPAIFAVQVSLAALWRSWGVAPDLVVGQSLGEAAAAYESGTLTLSEGMAVVHHRSRLMKSVEGRGRTALVGLSYTDACSEARAAGLEAAGSNGPASSLISGDGLAVSRLIAALNGRGVFARQVPGVELALHSAQMDALTPELMRELAGLRPQHSAIPFISSVVGNLADGTALDAAYWSRNLREPFLFTHAIERVLSDGCTVLLEISPHPVLLSSIQQCVRHHGPIGISIAGSLRRGESERAALLNSICGLYQAGHRVDWRRLYPAGGRVVSVPTYPWQRQRYWFDQLGSSAGNGTRDDRTGHPLLGAGLELAGTNRHVWESRIDIRRPSWLADHRVLGEIVLPGAACLELALAAAREIWPDVNPAATAVQFESMLRLDEKEPTRVQLVLEREDGAATFTLYSHFGEWRRHASGRLDSQAGSEPVTVDLRSIRERCPCDIDTAAHYATLLAKGLDYGPAFRRIVALRSGHHEALGEIVLQAPMRDTRYRVHPAMLDAALQVVAATVEGDHRYLPAGAERWIVHRTPGDRVYCHARLNGVPGQEVLHADLDLCDEQGQLLAQLSGLRLNQLSTPANNSLNRALIEETWPPRPLPKTVIGADGDWLVLGSDTGLTRRLASELQTRGHTAHVTESMLSGSWRAVVCITEGREPWRSALQAVQSLAEQSSDTRLWIVTRGAQPAAGAPSDPWQATPHGIALTAMLEHPALRYTAIDLDFEDHPDHASILAGELLASDTETRIAWRKGIRYAARVTAAAPARLDPVALDPDATYLITGGFGSLGLLSARALVESGARNIVLLGRSGPAGGIDQVASLEKSGAIVTVATCDMSDPATVHRLFAETLAALPPVRGVIHSAGVLDDAVLTRQSPERFRKVLAPKADGAWNLHQATRHLPLDFFVCYSSAASLVGSPGQGNYAAANAFLDALAAYRKGLGLPGLSINWGAWATAGMADEEMLRRMEAHGVTAIQPDEGVRLIRCLLSDARARVGVLPVNWAKFFERFPTGVPPLFQALGGASPKDRQTASNPITGLTRAELPQAINRLLHDELATVLGFDGSMRIDPGRGFFDLGMDSLMSLEFLNRVGSRLGMKLAATLVFDHPNLRTLGVHLLSVLPVPQEVAPATELDDLSEAELAQLLAVELEEGEVHAC
jgi:myxalamid-type polyketide synthase MxaE and MxaD